MRQNNYYSPHPEFLAFDQVPPNMSIGHTHDKDEKSFVNIQDPIRHGLKPLDPRIIPPPPFEGEKKKRGYVITNNAKLTYNAEFDFVFDDGSKKQAVVSKGDSIYVTFNNTQNCKKGEFEIITATGIITHITPVTGRDAGFVIYVDSSKRNDSCVYKIGSRTILDIGLLEIENDKENEETTDADHSGIIDPPEKHHHNYCRPHIHSEAIKFREFTYDKDWMGVTEIDIKFELYEKSDVLCVISDNNGNIVYKEIRQYEEMDTPGSRYFAWDLRNYCKAFRRLIAEDYTRPLKDKLGKHYTLDRMDEYVAVYSPSVQDLNFTDTVYESNDFIIPSINNSTLATTYKVDLYACPAGAKMNSRSILLDYTDEFSRYDKYKELPIQHVEASMYITQDMIDSAIFKSEEEIEQELLSQGYIVGYLDKDELIKLDTLDESKYKDITYPLIYVFEDTADIAMYTNETSNNTNNSININNLIAVYEQSTKKIVKGAAKDIKSNEVFSSFASNILSTTGQRAVFKPVDSIEEEDTSEEDDDGSDIVVTPGGSNTSDGDTIIDADEEDKMKPDLVIPDDYEDKNDPSNKSPNEESQSNSEDDDDDDPPRLIVPDED